MGETTQNNKKLAKSDNNDRLEWLRSKGFVRTLEFKNDKGQVVDTTEAVSYQGLLALAHEDGLKRVFTEVVQLPTKENERNAVFLAEVETNKGTFRDYGDANPQNVNYRITPHIIRMASTRSKARAFRDAVDIGVVCAEELDIELGSNGKLTARATPEKLKQIGNGKSKADQSYKPLEAAAMPAKLKSPQGQENGNGNKAKRKSVEQKVVVSPNAKTNRIPVPTAGTNGDYHMSDRQRNYLFRLASDLGYQGEEAHDFLKEKLQVESLKSATKQQANNIINELLRMKQEEKEELPF